MRHFVYLRKDRASFVYVRAIPEKGGGRNALLKIIDSRVTPLKIIASWVG